MTIRLDKRRRLSPPKAQTASLFRISKGARGSGTVQVYELEALPCRAVRLCAGVLVLHAPQRRIDAAIRGAGRGRLRQGPGVGAGRASAARLRHFRNNIVLVLNRRQLGPRRVSGGERTDQPVAPSDPLRTPDGGARRSCSVWVSAWL